MKKRIAAVLLTGALLSLALCACGDTTGEAGSGSAGAGSSGGLTATEPSLTSIDNKDKGSLALGMARADVEAGLPLVNGSETEAMGITYAYFGAEAENEVYVGFLDGVVTSLSVGGSSEQQPLESTNWSLKGITLGDKRDAVVKVLGEPTQESPVTVTGADGEATVAEGQVTLQYYYDADEKLLSPEESQSATMLIGILLDGDTVKSFGTFTPYQAGNAAGAGDTAEGSAPAEGAAE